jgi:hypothetical protein
VWGTLDRGCPHHSFEKDVIIAEQIPERYEMNENTRWKLIAGTVLVTLSIILYTAHFLIFQDSHHLSIFFIGDLAFIPIEVLLVTLIIDSMLESREKKRRMEKLNMVVGTFFSTLGTPLLAMLAKADPEVHSLAGQLIVRDGWKPEDFRNVQSWIKSQEFSIKVDRLDITYLRQFLSAKEELLLRLVENPMVFEHESFTGLLLAVNHLSEELKARTDLTSLPHADQVHLERDTVRVYTVLISEWLRYMEYLRQNYPFLFSLAMRTNPFDDAASVIIRQDP